MFGFGKASARSLVLLAATSVLLVISGNGGSKTPPPQDTLQESTVWQIGPATALPVTGLAKDLWASAAADDPDKLLVCTFETDGERAIHHSVVYASVDGGNTWMKTLDDMSSDFVSEPSCVSGREGNSFFVAGASNTSRGAPRHEFGTAEIFRSSDAGLHWIRLHRYPFIDWTSVAIGGVSSDDVYVFGHLMAEGVGDAGTGAWRSDVRPVLVSHNAGETFSGPHFPPDQKHNGYRRGYPVSALAVDNNSVVVLYAQALDPVPDINSKLGLAVYKVRGEQYTQISTVPLPLDVHDVEALSSQMAIDDGASHHGRLYIAFQAVANDCAVLVLSRSDDGGESWHSKVLLRGDRMPKLTGRLDYSVFTSIAVNRAGTVGMEWMSPSKCPIFALSLDGGTSLTGVRTLGSCEGQTHVSPLASIRCMDTINTAIVPSPPHDSVEESGFTLRVDTSLVWSSQIVADAGGRFHAFWPERKPDGSVGIMTASVTMGPLVSPILSTEAAEDVTTSFAVKVTAERYDPYNGEFGIDFVIKNSSTKMMSYPSLVEMSENFSDCGAPKYLNGSALSDNGRVLYRIPRPANRVQLLPGEASLPIHVEVRVEGCEDGNGSLFDRSRLSKPERWGFYTLSVVPRVYTLSPVQHPAKMRNASEK
jgi:hypothetical protein